MTKNLSKKLKIYFWAHYKTPRSVIPTINVYITLTLLNIERVIELLETGKNVLGG